MGQDHGHRKNRPANQGNYKPMKKKKKVLKPIPKIERSQCYYCMSKRCNGNCNQRKKFWTPASSHTDVYEFESGPDIGD